MGRSVHLFLLSCCLVVGSLLVAEEDAPAQPSAHRFTTGEVRRYLSELSQEVSWRSAADELLFQTSLAIEWSCFVQAVDEDGVATLIWRVLDIRASHRGPDSQHSLDSAQEAGGDDPLLGDLMIYHMQPLTLQVDSQSGQVQSLQGAEALQEALHQRHPPANPLAAPPRQQAAQQALHPERLRQMFSRFLAVPGQSLGPLQLSSGVSLPLHLDWQGEAFELSLEEDASSPLIQIYEDPAPLVLRVSAVQGSGKVQIDAEGVLQAVNGSMEMQIEAQAMTQSLTQKHQVEWNLRLLSRSTPAE